MSLDGKILEAMRENGGEGVSGAELSQRLGVSRAAVWARVEELRQLGYEIEASPHRGYRLVGQADVLHADDLLAQLGKTAVVGRDIRVFQETASTNDVVDKLARDGVPEGVVVFAESQTRGRGRLGRKWVSPAGKGLWFSILLRPALRPHETIRLTVASATALRRALHLNTGLDVKIKWPNDILIGQKKVVGILTELHAEVDLVKYVTLGIGVDVNQTAEEFPAELRKSATSLRAALGKPVSRAVLAVTILRELDRDYQKVRSGGFADLTAEWEKHCATIGQRVRITAGARQISGRAEALDGDGALLLRTDHGHLERIMGGDVTLEKN
jgi:BirA family biotin operon repressor/biotin-[acetyl-CoA-carboxylase] ligase